MDDCANVQKGNWPMTLGNSQFHNSTISQFHNLHVIQDRSCLEEAAEELNGEGKVFVSGECPVRVDAACRGPKAERARRRVAKVAPLKEEPNRRTKQPYDLQANALPRPFRRRNAARQAGSVSWCAPVGARIDKPQPSLFWLV